MKENNIMNETFIRLIGNYIIQAIPSPGLYKEDGVFGMYWEGLISVDLRKSNYLDNKNVLMTTSESYNTPESALDAAEKELERYDELCKKEHISDYSDMVMPIEDFKNKISDECHHNAYFEVISLYNFETGNFFTENGNFKGYLVHNDKVFWFENYTKYNLNDNIKNLRNPMMLQELIEKAFNCKLEDIKEVLFVDYMG